MTNPQSRRPTPPVEVTSDPTITPWLLRQIDDKIQQHEIRIAIYSSLVGTPILIYILLEIHKLKSLLGV